MANYVAAQRVALRRLRAWSAALKTEDVADQVAEAARLLRAQYPCVTAAMDASPPTISSDDMEWFEDAAGTLAAMLMLSSTLLLANGGWCARRGRTSNINSLSPHQSKKQEFTDQLSRALGYISCIRAARAAVAATVNIFGVAGHRRSQEARYGQFGYCGSGFEDAFAWLLPVLPGW